MEDDFAERVMAILTSGDLMDPYVEVTKNGHRWVALVVTATFEGINGAERQALVWDILERNLTEEEHRRIEFVFVRSPSEYQAEAA